MEEKYDRLKALLLELFQLNQPDLDFGIYRILRARADEIRDFLERRLPPLVREALSQSCVAGRAEPRQQGVEAARATAPAADHAGHPTNLRSSIPDRAALEAEVYDQLYRFFSRYYSEGDFLPRRVYREGVYALPYEGEEVRLHWVNSDQHYIKTGEYLRDYAFRLRPDDEAHPMRVHFTLVNAAEGEHGNVKAAEDRAFVLAARDFIAEEDGELVIRFEYRPATTADWPAGEGRPKPPSQKELIAIAVARVLGVEDPALSPWIQELGREHVLADGRPAGYTRLEAHLRRYTARNTFDYFIHKDLGGFLRRELDFYLKNEVLQVDNLVDGAAPLVEQHLGKIKVIRQIALKIIDFLAQIEDFQKKLWRKKKFVVDTQYCVTLAAILALGDEDIRSRLLAEIAANAEQWAEWHRLGFLWEPRTEHGPDRQPGRRAGERSGVQWGDQTDDGPGEQLGHRTGDVGGGPSGQPADVVAGVAPGEPPGHPSARDRALEFLLAHPSLPVDTRHFSEEFKGRLLEALGDLDELTDAILIQADNYHALDLLQTRFRQQIGFVYIDPPYNTGNDGFAYKDRYRHSTWLTMMADRLALARELLAPDGTLFISIDDNEVERLKCLGEMLFGPEGYLNTFVWVNNLKGRQIAGRGAAGTHEYVLAFGGPDAGVFTAPVGRLKELMPSAYRGLDYDTKCDTLGPYVTKNELHNTNSKFNEETRPNLVFNIHYNFETGEVRFSAVDEDVDYPGFVKIPPRRNNDGRHRYHAWRWSKEKIARDIAELEFVQTAEGVRIYTKVRHFAATALKDVITDITTAAGSRDLAQLFGSAGGIDYPKPVALVEVFVAQSRSDAWVLDFFAGSGTTGQAVIRLNRAEDARRRFILVEAGQCFDALLVPRIKKAVFAPDWRDGRPVRLPTPEEVRRGPRVVKVMRLESYEDALNNLELRRTPTQEELLARLARENPAVRDEYLLRYMLDVESRASLLGVEAFADPTAYRLKVRRPGCEETRAVPVDLMETFNWLLGLSVTRMCAPERFRAAFRREADGRLVLDGDILPDPQGPWWFRSVEGVTPDGRRALMIWRRLTGDPERDDLVLGRWLDRRRQSPGWDLVYVNGSHTLGSLPGAGTASAVRLIEEEFHRLMFAETEGV